MPAIPIRCAHFRACKSGLVFACDLICPKAGFGQGSPRLDHFLYRDGALFAEDVPVAEIAAAVGTPFYVYSTATLKRHFTLFDDALAWGDHLVCFAMKSLSNQAVIKVLGDAGAGMDVVSAGEYLRAKAAGISGEKIVFSGVGKTAEEMRLAITGGIRQFNIESEPEMIVLDQVAQSLGAVVPVTIRVNPDVDAKTHAKIATGKSENKFGIPISRAREVYAMAGKLAGLKVESVKKRFTEKSFAAGANRQRIAKCSEIGLELDDFIELGLEAMKEIAGDLRL